MPNIGPSPLALFPLTAHVLPGGLLPLRIFEPRYLRMVKESCRSGDGFGMCMVNPREGKALRNMFAIGTWVKVVDFETLADGMLGITVAGQHCFHLDQLWQEEDGLRFGTLHYLPPWPEQPLSDHHHHLRDQLQQLYASHDHLSRLYPAPLPTSATWICLRWLELLPIAAADKQYLLEQPDCRPTLAFLHQAFTSGEAALPPSSPPR